MEKSDISLLQLKNQFVNIDGSNVKNKKKQKTTWYKV